MNWLQPIFIYLVKITFVIKPLTADHHRLDFTPINPPAQCHETYFKICCRIRWLEQIGYFYQTIHC